MATFDTLSRTQQIRDARKRYILEVWVKGVGLKTGVALVISALVVETLKGMLSPIRLVIAGVGGLVVTTAVSYGIGVVMWKLGLGNQDDM